MSCSFPFDLLYLLPDGFVTCCQSWLDPGFWMVGEDSARRAWNSAKLKELRRRVDKGDFSQCKGCVRMGAGEVPEQAPDDAAIHMTRGPRKLIICNDLICNLHCWTCRAGTIGKTPGYDRRDEIMHETIQEFLPDLEVIELLQSGEALASPSHLRFLREFDAEAYPNIKLRLTTNGTLLAKKWDEIKACHKSLKMMSISVDAATKETYEVVRGGGKWEDVKKGCEFSSFLRFNGDLEHLQTNFCVYGENFREIPEFIRWCGRLGVDRCRINMLRPFWQEKEQFDRASLANPNHPDRAEFIEILRCEELRRPYVEAPQLVGEARDLHTTLYHLQ